MPEEKPLRLLRYGRHWAVYEDDALLCVTVYKKGALAVIERLERSAPAMTLWRTRTASSDTTRMSPVAISEETHGGNIMSASAGPYPFRGSRTMCCSIGETGVG